MFHCSIHSTISILKTAKIVPGIRVSSNSSLFCMMKQNRFRNSSSALIYLKIGSFSLTRSLLKDFTV